MFFEHGDIVTPQREFPRCAKSRDTGADDGDSLPCFWK